jgi:F420-0:gamma-glutamyl ligase
MKTYQIKVEEHPLAKAFLKIAEIIAESLDNIQSDDIVTIQDETPTTTDTMHNIMIMLKRHSRPEARAIIRGLHGFYNGE